MVLVDGQEADTLDVRDRGLQYGDGLFETLAVDRGEPRDWQAHLDRLESGCDRLGIPSPDPATLAAEADRLCAGAERAVLKILVTRGSGGRGYRPPAEPAPRRILMRSPWPDYPGYYWTEGVRVRHCRTRLGENPALAGLKHLNRLEQVLARAEWDDPEVAEGLMCDATGRLVEGTMSNLFWVRDGVLHTPDLSRCGVAGVVRARVLEWAEANGRPARVVEAGPEELEGADEVFLTNSVIGLWPVRELAGRSFPVGAVSRALPPILRAP